MRFLVDADLPRAFVDALRRDGHDAMHVHDLEVPVTGDELVARTATETGRCLVTSDFDFADVRNYDPHRHAGIVVLAVPRAAGSDYAFRLVAGSQLDEIGRLEGKLVIAESGCVRVRD